MTQAGIEPTIPESERPQAHALERVATGTGKIINLLYYFQIFFPLFYFVIILKISHS